MSERPLASSSLPAPVRVQGSVLSVGGVPVRRLLPRRGCRRVGAWCLLDHFGPAEGGAMHVPPHPHVGLQTVTWLLEGETLHLDSLGSRQPIRPGELNWMTAGSGIAHAELGQPGRSHGVQLWVALPPAAEEGPPAFVHHARLPSFEVPGARVTVLAGDLAGVASPAATFTPLLAADLELAPGAGLRLPVRSAFEHGVAVLEGEVDVLGERGVPGELVYLSPGRTSLSLSSAGPARVLLLGGEPFEHPVHMYWNFVGSSRDRLAEAVTRWRDAGFPPVPGYDGPGLPAPDDPPETLL